MPFSSDDLRMPGPPCPSLLALNNAIRPDGRMEGPRITSPSLILLQAAWPSEERHPVELAVMVKMFCFSAVHDGSH